MQTYWWAQWAQNPVAMACRDVHLRNSWSKYDTVSSELSYVYGSWLQWLRVFRWRLPELLIADGAFYIGGGVGLALFWNEWYSSIVVGDGMVITHSWCYAFPASLKCANIHGLHLDVLHITYDLRLKIIPIFNSQVSVSFIPNITVTYSPVSKQKH